MRVGEAASPAAGVWIAAEVAWVERLAGFPVLAEAVVLLAFVGVAEDFVGLADLAEGLAGVGVVFVDVRVVFARELAVGAFDLIGRGRAGDAEGLVVVLKRNTHARSRGWPHTIGKRCSTLPKRKSRRCECLCQALPTARCHCGGVRRQACPQRRANHRDNAPQERRSTARSTPPPDRPASPRRQRTVSGPCRHTAREPLSRIRGAFPTDRS